MITLLFYLLLAAAMLACWRIDPTRRAPVQARDASHLDAMSHETHDLRRKK